MRIAFSVFPVLFAIACSSILVPAASTTKGGGLFHAADPPFNGGGGGGGGGSDSGTYTGPMDDTGTSTWTTDTGGTTTSTQDCPFGNSAELQAYYTVVDDGCGWGTEGFPATASLVCTGGDFEMTDTGFLGSTLSCTGDGTNFTCEYGQGSFSATMEGKFTKGGTQASGTWYLSSYDCSGGGDFTWE